MKKRKLFFIGITLTAVALGFYINRSKPGPYATYGLTATIENGVIIIRSPNYREYGNDSQAMIRRLIDGEIPNTDPDPFCNIMVTMEQPPSASFRYMRKESAPEPFINLRSILKF